MAFTVVVSAVGSSVGGLFMLAVGSFSLTGAGVDPGKLVAIRARGDD